MLVLVISLLISSAEQNASMRSKVFLNNTTQRGAGIETYTSRVCARNGKSVTLASSLCNYQCIYICKIYLVPHYFMFGDSTFDVPDNYLISSN